MCLYFWVQVLAIRSPRHSGIPSRFASCCVLARVYKRNIWRKKNYSPMLYLYDTATAAVILLTFAQFMWDVYKIRYGFNDSEERLTFITELGKESRFLTFDGFDSRLSLHCFNPAILSAEFSIQTLL